MTHYYPTLLQIIPLSGSEGFTLPPFAARSLTQSLKPIAGIGGSSNALGTLIRRDIQGTLIDLFPHQFRKYAVVVTCTDVQSPAIDLAWLGQTVELHSALELSYLVGQTAGRPAVPGSTRTVGHYTFYRPVLIMKVVGVDNNDFEEWKANYKWQLSFQEV